MYMKNNNTFNSKLRVNYTFFEDSLYSYMNSMIVSILKLSLIVYVNLTDRLAYALCSDQPSNSFSSRTIRQPYDTGENNTVSLIPSLRSNRKLLPSSLITDNIFCALNLVPISVIAHNLSTYTYILIFPTIDCS